MSGKYTIKQVANLTDLTKEVIRKWEQRYDLVKPTRMANGYRLFSDWDVHVLKRMKHLVEEGYSAKNAAFLVKEEGEKEQNITVIHTSNEGTEYVNELLEAGKRGDEATIERVLQQVFHVYSLAFLIEKVIVPFLQQIGECCQKGEWREYQEHVASLVVRDFLIQIRRNDRAGDGAPLVLGACLPGERHEIPVHLALLGAMVYGWRTMFLGTSPAPGAIEAAVETFQPSAVLLSSTTTLPLEDRTNIKKIDRFAARYPHINFYIGGQGVHLIEPPLECKAIKQLDDWRDIFAPSSSS